MARISVSRFSGDLSLVRRISTAEKRLNTSSVDSGSSQNCAGQSTCLKSEIRLRAYRGPVRVISWNTSFF
jgi:hypothetical protein